MIRPMPAVRPRAPIPPSSSSGVPATNSIPKAMAHSSRVVPRSGSSITSAASSTVRGSTGTSRWRTSPRRRALRVSTSAENSSRAELGELGRLDGEPAGERDPAGRPVGRDRPRVDEHVDQAGGGQHQQGRAQPAPDAVVDAADHQHHHHPAGHPHELALEVGVGVALLGQGEHRGGGQHHDQADDQQGAGHGEQQPVGASPPSAAGPRPRPGVTNRHRDRLRCVARPGGPPRPRRRPRARRSRRTGPGWRRPGPAARCRPGRPGRTRR